MAKISAEKLMADIASNDSKVRWRASMVLGGLKPETEIDMAVVIAALESTNDTVVFWAEIALRRLGERGSAAIPQLIRLVDRPELFICQSALEALVAAGPRDPRARSAVYGAFRHPEPAMRRQALQSCIYFPDHTADELALITGMSSDPDRHVTSWSETALRNIRLRNQPPEPAAPAPMQPDADENGSDEAEFHADKFTEALCAVIRDKKPFPDSLLGMITWCAEHLPHQDWKKVLALDFADDLAVSQRWIPKVLQAEPCEFEIRGLYFGLAEMGNAKDEEYAELSVAFLGQYDPEDREAGWAQGELRHDPAKAVLKAKALKAAGLIFNRASGAGFGNEGSYMFGLSYALLLVAALLTPELYQQLAAREKKVGVLAGWDSGDVYRVGELTPTGFVPNRGIMIGDEA